MIKITHAQLEAGASLAYEISKLEIGRDVAEDHVTRIHVVSGVPTKADPLGSRAFIDVTISRDDIREQLAEKIKVAHAQLRDLGMELVG